MFIPLKLIICVLEFLLASGRKSGISYGNVMESRYTRWKKAAESAGKVIEQNGDFSSQPCLIVGSRFWLAELPNERILETHGEYMRICHLLLLSLLTPSSTNNRVRNLSDRRSWSAMPVLQSCTDHLVPPLQQRAATHRRCTEMNWPKDEWSDVAIMCVSENGVYPLVI